MLHQGVFYCQHCARSRVLDHIHICPWIIVGMETPATIQDLLSWVSDLDYRTTRFNFSIQDKLNDNILTYTHEYIRTNTYKHLACIYNFRKILWSYKKHKSSQLNSVIGYDIINLIIIIEPTCMWVIEKIVCSSGNKDGYY